MDLITGQRNLIGWIVGSPIAEILLVEIAMSKNLVGRSPDSKIIFPIPNYERKKSDWLNCPPPWNSIGWNRNLKKPYWWQCGPKITSVNHSVNPYVFWPCGQTSRQLMFARLFSTRKRIIMLTPRNCSNSACVTSIQLIVLSTFSYFFRP